MKRFTLATALAVAVLLLCSSPSRMQAQPGDTKIVIKDGGSIIMRADGLDAGLNWTLKKGEVRHHNSAGLLTGLQVTEADADKCGGNPTCGIDPTQPWKIQVAYGSGTLIVSSIAANKGIHLTHSKLPFDKWQHTANTDEREFGHGDGNRISSLRINGGNSLCSGKGCVITVSYRPQ